MGSRKKIDNRDSSTYDKGHYVFLIFLYFGVTALLPFNAFITPAAFYTAFYGYNEDFTNLISFCYNQPAVVMSIIMVIWGRRWPIIPRMMVSLGLFLVALIFIPFVHVMFGIEDMSTYPKDENNHPIDVPNAVANEVVTLIFVFLSGVSNGIFFPTIIQLATMHGDVFSQAIMEGNGIGGAIPVIINIITHIFVSDPQIMAEIYFIVAANFVALSFLFFFLLYEIPFSRSRVQKAAPLRCCSRHKKLPTEEPESGTNDYSVNNETGILDKSSLGVSDYTGNSKALGNKKRDGDGDGEGNNRKRRRDTGAGDISFSDDGERSDKISPDEEDEKPTRPEKGDSDSSNSEHSSQLMSTSGQMKPADNEAYNKKFNKRPTRVIFKALILPELGVCFIFLITLALFPATMLRMGINEDLDANWVSIIVIGVFNLVDWLGRALPKYQFVNKHKWLNNPKLLFIYSCSRIIFIPLIVIPVIGIFTSTAYTVIVDIIFALTNGFISSMLMMKGPFLVENDLERQIGGTLMTVMMNLGLTAGSALNLAFLALPEQV